MLKLTPNPTFTAIVEISSPGGEKEKVEFTFNYKTKPEYDEFMARTAKSKSKKAAVEALIEIVSGWSGIDSEFSNDSLSKLIENYQGVETRIFAKYVEELTGARLGN